VTDIPDVSLEDRVTLVGTDGDETITAEQIAAQAGSFNYEFICSIGRRVPRVYYRNGSLVRSVHYLLDNNP
jgi:alanine racemase